MNIKQRHFIKSTEIKDLQDDLQRHYDQAFVSQIFPRKCQIESILTEAGDMLYAVNGKLVLWKSQDGYIPVLSFLLDNKVKLKTVVVDMGAIRYLTNRADVMIAGITKIDPSIKKNDIIQIVDETHGRALAVGKALFDADEMEKKTEGKVIKNLHTIKKDPVWKFAKEFK